MRKLLVLLLTTLSIDATTLFYNSIPIELRVSYGSTLQQLSKTDLPHNINDFSMSAGVGRNLPYGFDIFAHLSYSKYFVDGNGYALTPIINTAYTQPLYKEFGLYLGTGIGLGYDEMKIKQYTNKWKWTIDFLFGINYELDYFRAIKIGTILRHKSHSFVGDSAINGKSSSNIGYNGLMFDLHYKTLLSI